MRRIKSQVTNAQQDLLIPVTREEVDQDRNKATLVAAQELMHSISTPPEQEIKPSVPPAEKETTPPPSPSEKELPVHNVPPLELAGEEETQVVTDNNTHKPHGCCDLL